jgi:hypothetical protein
MYDNGRRFAAPHLATYLTIQATYIACSENSKMRSRGNAASMLFVRGRHALLMMFLLLVLAASFSASSRRVTVDAFQFTIPTRRTISNSRFVSSFTTTLPLFAKKSRKSTQPKHVWEMPKRRRRQETPQAFSSIQASWKHRRTLLGLLRPQRPLERFSQQLFDDADTNGDGWITVSEAYEFLLQMYIIMNRHAPLSPPTRAKVEQLFYEYDNNRLDRGLNRDEFTQLMQHFTQRAFSRMMAHRWVTLVGAPLCTEGVLRLFRPMLGRADPIRAIFKATLPTRMLPIITSITFLRSMLLIFFATTLADIVLAIVDWALDMTTPAATLPDLTTILPLSREESVADVVEKSRKKLFDNITEDFNP